MIVKCFECGGRISDTARICPHCGYKGAYGRWLNAGATAAFTEKFTSRVEAQKALSEETSAIAASLRRSIPFGTREK